MALELATTGDLALYRVGDDSSLLGQAEADVRNYCGWHISPARVADVLVIDGFTCGKVLLPSRYVTAVASVAIDGAVLAASAYVWHQGGWIDMLTQYSSPRQVVVTLTHGYPVPPLPVTRAVLELVERAKAAVPGAKSASAGPFAVTYGEGFSSGTALALAPYALPGFA